MPNAVLRYCKQPGCPQRVRSGYCERHQRDYGRERDRKRPTAAQRGYDWHWAAYREAFMAQNPLCAECERNGRVSASAELDHITPRSVRPDLFWSRSNHQALCLQCHREKTAREKREGRIA